MLENVEKQWDIKNMQWDIKEYMTDIWKSITDIEKLEDIEELHQDIIESLRNTWDITKFIWKDIIELKNSVKECTQ